MQAKNVEFVLPTDVVIADKFDKDANSKVVKVDDIPEGWMVSSLPASPPTRRLSLRQHS